MRYKDAGSPTGQIKVYEYSKYNCYLW